MLDIVPYLLLIDLLRYSDCQSRESIEESHQFPLSFVPIVEFDLQRHFHANEIDLLCRGLLKYLCPDVKPKLWQ